MFNQPSLVALACLLVGSAATGHAVAEGEVAAEAPEAPEVTEPEGAESDMSLGFELGVASAYVWRGANLWTGLLTNAKQAATLFPSITFSKGEFTAFYFGAYQLSGRTRGENVDLGSGAEQDLGLSYLVRLGEALGLAGFVTYYVYPLADTNELGGVPMWIEPGARATYDTVVALTLSVSYLKALSVIDANDPSSHIYISPSVERDIELSPWLALNLGIAGGYKVFTNSAHDAEVEGNNFDVEASVGATFTTNDCYVSPSVHVGTTDVPKTADHSGLFYFAGLNVGYELAL